MSDYDTFAHDLFPDKRDMVAFTNIGHPLLQIMEENTRHSVGKGFAYPAYVQGPIAQAGTRAQVQEVADQGGDVANFDGEEFMVPYFAYKAGFNISELEYATTEGSGGVPEGAYMEKFAISMRNMLDNWGARKEFQFVTRAGRSIARTTANGGTTTLNTGIVRLSDVGIVNRFRKHQLIQASVNTGAVSTHQLIDSESVAYVINVQPDDNEITVSSTSNGSAGHANWNTAASTNQLYLFNYGDFQAVGRTTLLAKGFQDWVPGTWSSTIDSAGNFFGVNRGTNPRLAGARLPAAEVTGYQLDSVLENVLDHMSTNHGAKGQYVFPLSKKRWTSMSRIAKARGYRMLNGGSATFGYSSIVIEHGDMSAKIVAVPQMQQDDLFGLKLENDGWVERHLGQGFKVLNGDGLKMLRKAADDSYEIRLRDFFHWGCNAINHQVRADISAVAL
jgi:hypothetical protein